MYDLQLTEDEISIILQALNYFQYENPYITEEQYDIANNVTNKIDYMI